MKREIIITEDGSHTLHVPELNEHYHSTHGAIQESQHVYIEAGLKEALKSFSEIRLLEIGFGTGLNAALTLLAVNPEISVYYTGIEAYPLTREEIEAVNYPDLLDIDVSSFYHLHQVPWNKGFTQIASDFFLEKICDKLEIVNFPQNRYNVVYFDAFAPTVQPELWEKNIFEKIFAAMTFDGILTTYSAKGSVRRTMQEVGFSVERIPAPAGKREMLRARKK
jgi:tRNA U34 5-methylaminomethyl-2-thiouridine-forming methyltransferase MnmC